MKKFSTIFITLLSIFALVSCAEAPTKESLVKFETSQGIIILKLYDDTPVHKANFLEMVSSGFYEGVLFHRVIDNFMIQAGDPTSKGAAAGALLGEESFGENLPNEITSRHFHKKGVLAAAREGNDVNPTRRSSASHFYIARGKVYQKDSLEAYVAEVNRKRKVAFEALESSAATLVPLELSAEQIETYTTVGGIPHLDGEYTIFGEVVEGLEIVDKIIIVETDEHDRPLEDVVILRASLI